MSVDSYMNFQVRARARARTYTRRHTARPMRKTTRGGPLPGQACAHPPPPRCSPPPPPAPLAVVPATPVATRGVCMQLANSEEYIDGALAGSLGEILIRCNNVLYVRAAPEAAAAAAAAAADGGGA